MITQRYKDSIGVYIYIYIYRLIMLNDCLFSMLPSTKLYHDRKEINNMIFHFLLVAHFYIFPSFFLLHPTTATAWTETVCPHHL